MRRKTRIRRAIGAGGLTLLSLAAVTAGCGGESSPEGIVLQLFRSAGSAAEGLTISVQQIGGDTGQVTIAGEEITAFFADCEHNRVRVLPRVIPSQPLELKISVSGGGVAGTTSATVGESAATEIVPIVLGGAPLEPAGCAPPSPTGSACDQDQLCSGGICLEQFGYETSGPIEMPGGYCSAACDATNACAPDEQCQPMRDANLQEIGRYCLAPCADGCRSGYTCSTSGFCFPTAS